MPTILQLNFRSLGGVTVCRREGRLKYPPLDVIGLLRRACVISNSRVRSEAWSSGMQYDATLCTLSQNRIPAVLPAAGTAGMLGILLAFLGRRLCSKN